MRQNICNAANDERFQVQCGTVDDIIDQRTEGRAFRCAVELADATQKYANLARLARFRIIRVGKGKRIYVRSPWFYQEPSALLDTQ